MRILQNAYNKRIGGKQHVQGLQKKAGTAPATDTLLANGTSFEGTIEAEANIRIDAYHFQGDIRSTRAVVIGESAVVRSDIIAQDVILVRQGIRQHHHRGTADDHAYGRTVR